MSEIVEMERERDILALSSKLKTAATGLKKLLNGEELVDYEKREIAYAADLLGQIDWDSKQYRGHMHPELSVIATRLRPMFFKRFVEAGIPSRGGYYDRLCDVLRSSGRVNKESRWEYELIRKVLQSVSDEILSGLQYTHMMADTD